MRIQSPLFLLASALLISCSTHTAKPPLAANVPAAKVRSYVIQEDVVYTPSGWPETLHADIYQPDSPGPWPAVLLIHGGSWGPQDRRSDMVSTAKQLVKRGYVVVNATYRVVPEYHFPAPVEDLQEALSWMRKNARTLHINPEKLAVFGYSAGGHLAEMLGVMADPSKTRVKAVVAGGAPSDMRKFPDGRLIVRFIGGNMKEKPLEYNQASPITQVTSDDPPFFLYHGKWDRLVPIDQTTDFVAALEKAGVPYELFWLNGRGHVAAFLTQDAAVAAAIDFLDRILR